MPPTNPAELTADDIHDLRIAVDQCEADAVDGDDEGHVERLRAIVDRLASLLEREPVPEVGATPGVVDYVLRFGSRCRDCADEDGVCPASGLPCDGARKAVEHVVGALNYGVEHGYITLADAGFKVAASPPPPSVDRERLSALTPPDEEAWARVIDPEAWKKYDNERSNPTKVWPNKDVLYWLEYYRLGCADSLAKARTLIGMAGGVKP